MPRARAKFTFPPPSCENSTFGKKNLHAKALFLSFLLLAGWQKKIEWLQNDKTVGRGASQ